MAKKETKEEKKMKKDKFDERYSTILQLETYLDSLPNEREEELLFYNGFKTALDLIRNNRRKNHPLV